MSKYDSFQTTLTEEGALVAALKALGYPVEIHTQAMPLFGYHGHERPERAHIISIALRTISDLYGTPMVNSAPSSPSMTGASASIRNGWWSSTRSPNTSVTRRKRNRSNSGNAGELLMQVHAVMACSLVNGPGRRTVVWFQGCKLSCPGCWN